MYHLSMYLGIGNKQIRLSYLPKYNKKIFDLRFAECKKIWRKLHLIQLNVIYYAI